MCLRGNNISIAKLHLVNRFRRPALLDNQRDLYYWELGRYK